MTLTAVNISDFLFLRHKFLMYTTLNVKKVMRIGPDLDLLSFFSGACQLLFVHSSLFLDYNKKSTITPPTTFFIVCHFFYMLKNDKTDIFHLAVYWNVIFFSYFCVYSNHVSKFLVKVVIWFGMSSVFMMQTQKHVQANIKKFEDQIQW